MNALHMSYRQALLGVAAAVGLAFSSAQAWGEEVKLGGDNEVPPVQTMAKGSGSITINPDMTVSGKITTMGVAATMAHIHQGPMGQNGPVIIPLAKSGDNGWEVPPGAKLSEAQYQAYKAGGLYVNVHSDAHKGGEIRAQLKP